MRKKTLLAFFLFILIILPAFATNLVEIPNKKGVKLFFDRSSVTFEDPYIAYRINVEANDGSKSKIQMISDCQNNKTGILYMIKTCSNGKIIKDIKNQNTFNLSTNIPESIASNVHDYACKIDPNKELLSLDRDTPSNNLETLITSIQKTDSDDNYLKKREYQITSKLSINNASKEDIISLLKKYCDGSGSVGSRTCYYARDYDAYLEDIRGHGTKLPNVIRFYNKLSEIDGIPYLFDINEVNNTTIIRSFTSLFLIKNDFIRLVNYLSSYYPDIKTDFYDEYLNDYYDRKIEKGNPQCPKKSEIIINNAHKFDVYYLFESMRQCDINVNCPVDLSYTGLISNIEHPFDSYLYKVRFPNAVTNFNFTIHQRDNATVITSYKSIYLIQDKINMIIEYLKHFYPEVYVNNNQVNSKT
ncbi:MAG: hypothetical protein PHC34_02565 [Candidatus Gastranaerophilales bacterium]|nr:hypothetical protein [Candidatus Gastranaerophilales bacterium]